MGILLLIAIIIFLLICLWLPAVIQLRKKEILIFKAKTLFILFSMPLIVVFLVLGAESIGLLNPGGLILAFTASISMLGYLYAKFIAS